MSIEIVPTYGLFVNEENAIPVVLATAGDLPATGFANTAVRVKYSKASDSGLTNFNPSASQWTERGDGCYVLTLPALVLSEVGVFMYVIEPVTSGFLKVRAGTRVEKRVGVQLLETVASGYDDGTVGDELTNSGADKYEVFATPAYDFDGAVLKVRAWMHKNGELVDDPVSCEVIVKDEAGATVASQTGSSPDADGFFLFTINPQTPDLDATKNFSVRARITDADGNQHVSGETWSTLN